MAAKKVAAAVVSEDKIRQIAHQLWVESGQPEGQAEDHWFKAIELASAKAAKKAAAKPAVTAKPVAAAKPAVTTKPAAAAKPAVTTKPAVKKAK